MLCSLLQLESGLETSAQARCGNLFQPDRFRLFTWVHSNEKAFTLALDFDPKSSVATCTLSGTQGSKMYSKTSLHVSAPAALFSIRPMESSKLTIYLPATPGGQLSCTVQSAGCSLGTASLFTCLCIHEGCFGLSSAASC